MAAQAAGFYNCESDGIQIRPVGTPIIGIFHQFQANISGEFGYHESGGRYGVGISPFLPFFSAEGEQKGRAI
jgi:hypothetical protein